MRGDGVFVGLQGGLQAVVEDVCQCVAVGGGVQCAVVKLGEDGVGSGVDGELRTEARVVRAACAVGEDEDVRAAGRVYGEAEVVVAKAAAVRMAATAYARGEQGAVCAAEALAGVVRFVEGVAGVGGQVLPQAFRIGVDVQAVADLLYAVCAAHQDGEHDVARSCRCAVQVPVVPMQSAVGGGYDVGDVRCGKWHLVVLPRLGVGQGRQGDVLLDGGGAGFEGEYGHGGSCGGHLFCVLFGIFSHHEALMAVKNVDCKRLS